MYQLQLVYYHGDFHIDWHDKMYVSIVLGQSATDDDDDDDDNDNDGSDINSLRPSDAYMRW